MARDFFGREVTPYFERRVLENPQREHLLPFVIPALEDPEEVLVQEDGKKRHYRYVRELGRHVRVVTTADGALFNAHDDSAYTRRKERG